MARRLSRPASNRKMVGRRLLVAALSSLLAGWASAVTEIVILKRAPTVAREVQHGEATVYEPHTRFNCRQPIYFTMDAEPYRGQTLAVTWRGPDGMAKEVVRMAVENDATGWVVELRLSKGGNPVDFLSGPGAGFEELVGEWTVELASDERLWTGTFEVMC